VNEPKSMRVAADVILCSGAFNTLDSATFFSTIRHAFAAAKGALVFNYLCSPALASANYLRWHKPPDVLKLARSLSESVKTLDDYLPGDCTVAVYKVDERSGR